MSRPKMTRKFGLLASVALLLVGFLGCSVDTPTAPDQVPAPPPSVGGDNWNVSVSVDPDVLEAEVGGEGEGTGVIEPAIVSVLVTSRVDGSYPSNGTTMTVSTSLGELGSQGSEVTSVGVVLERGKAGVYLFPGNIVATGQVTARLQGSSGRDTFEVRGTVNPFITAVSPNQGSESGGTRITIRGTGFVAPLIVTVGDFPATVTSVTETEIKAITPPASGPLDFVACGNGGKEYLPTPFDVNVEPATAESVTLENGFFYTPDNTGCIGGG